MRKRFQRLISSYVALCLAFAGTVGISPVLHQWVEHGGHGPAHLHIGGVATVAIPSHQHDEEVEHAEGFGLEEQHYAAHLRHRPIFVHSHDSFTFPTIQLNRLWHALSRFLAAHGDDSSKPGPEHHHNSLAQLLASGLIEQAIDLAQLDHGPGSLTRHLLPAEPPLPASSWDAQTASRGPPAVRS